MAEAWATTRPDIRVTACAALALFLVIMADSDTGRRLMPRTGAGPADVPGCASPWTPAQVIHDSLVLDAETCYADDGTCVWRVPEWCYFGWCKANGTAVVHVYGHTGARACASVPRV